MINLPIFDRFDVTSYGLFPGQKDEPGLHISFLPGLTFILGANGLGKTTLITMLYRMLTGPYDISALAGGAPSLGSASLKATQITSGQKAAFSQRVVDGARTASASLTFTLGDHSVAISRKLKNLQLTSFQIDGIEQTLNEKVFQEKIPEIVGVWSFGDWILLLRHIVFYFEDRRVLVWDPTAQRQLLRILLLPIDLAHRWAEEEREILELDSRVRNLNATLFRETQVVGITESKVKSAKAIRNEMKSLDEHQQTDVARREELDQGIPDLESRRQTARLRLLKAEQEREARYRELERAKLMAIEARFPDRSESARYILAQLMTSSECLFCGNKVPAIAAQLESRISAQQCIVCGSNLAKPLDIDYASIADNRVSEYVTALRDIEPELTESRLALQEAEVEYNAFIREGMELDAAIAKRSARLEELTRRLPPEEAALLKQRAELATLRGRVEILKADLSAKRGAFKEFIQGESRSLAAKSQDIQTCFNHYAKGFLFDDCVLTWSPHHERLGQGGEIMAFPAFEVELGGMNFPSPVRRSGPEQVSESQREFIDLAFRMALMEIAATDGIGSLVIDAPESSLDVIFSKRAAEVLARFAEPKKQNRLILTSNLIEGSLIPDLVGLTTNTLDRDDRIVDLFKLAEPTKATREMKNEYEEALKSMLERAEPNPQGGSGSTK